MTFNLLSIHDFIELCFYLKRSFIFSFLRRFSLKRQNATKATWDIIHYPQKYWSNISVIQNHISALVSGNPDKGNFEYIAEKYLKARAPITALSIASGRGYHELDWTNYCNFKILEGIELSEKLVEYANKNAKNKSELVFYAGDFSKVKLENKKYDVIFAWHSLHHFKGVEKIVKKIKDALKPSGLLIFEEYVGPNRFQWKKEQLQAINELLSIIPKKYCKRYQLCSIKKKVHKPGLLRMVLYDPSEAVESENILPAVKKHFKIVELKELGGTLLHPLFHDIAYIFKEEDAESMKYVKMCIDKEVELLKLNKINSDFVLAVCQKKLE